MGAAADDVDAAGVVSAGTPRGTRWVWQGAVGDSVVGDAVGPVVGQAMSWWST